MDDPLLKRLDRLERDNQRLKLACVLIVMGLCAVGVMAQVSRLGRSVEAERFNLIDGQGNLRAALAMGPDGSARLSFHDADAPTARVMLGLNQGNPSLTFADSVGRPRIVLSAAADGSASLGFRGKERTFPGASLSVLPSGAVALVLYDAGGKARAGLGVEDHGRAGLDFFDQSGKVIRQVQ